MYQGHQSGTDPRTETLPVCHGHYGEPDQGVYQEAFRLYRSSGAEPLKASTGAGSIRTLLSPEGLSRVPTYQWSSMCDTATLGRKLTLQKVGLIVDMGRNPTHN